MKTPQQYLTLSAALDKIAQKYNYESYDGARGFVERNERPKALLDMMMLEAARLLEAENKTLTDVLNQLPDASKWIPVTERLPEPDHRRVLELCCDLGYKDYYYCHGICVKQYEVLASPSDYDEDGDLANYDELNNELYLKPGIYESIYTGDIRSEFDVWYLKRDVKFWKYHTHLPEKP